MGKKLRKNLPFNLTIDVVPDFRYTPKNMVNQRKPRDFFNRRIRIIRYYLKKAYCRFIKIQGEPGQIALGFAVGVFFGMLPIMGFQMAIAIFFAALLRCNKISAAAGAWITNPITAPFFYGLSYYIGDKVLNFKSSYEPPEDFNLGVTKNIIVNAPHIIWTMIVGGIILGIPFAVVSYYLSNYFILKYRRDIKDRITRRKQTFICKERELIKRLKDKKIKNQIKKTG